NVIGVQVIAAIRIAGRQADTVGHGVGVVVDVIADEDGKRPSGLKIENVTEFEVAQDFSVRPLSDEVSHEPVTDVLNRVGTLEVAAEQGLRGADESGEGTVVDSVGESVAGIETEITA